MLTTLSVKQTREKLAEIIERVAYGGEEIIVTRFGRPQVKIVAVDDTVLSKTDDSENIIKEAAGIWADRKDMKDPVKWVRNIRKTRFSLD